MTGLAMTETVEPAPEDDGHSETSKQLEAPADVRSSEAAGLIGYGSRSEDRSGAEARSAGDPVARACSYAISANTRDNGGEC
ncbi:MAG: hypothetical protein ACRBK7_02220 [Acidimicrobiales bacterium]